MKFCLNQSRQKNVKNGYKSAKGKLYLYKNLPLELIKICVKFG